jgi:predicted glycosyltransferase
LPQELARHRVAGPVEDVHHLMAFAQMVVGESATMSSEAAVLGVPAVFIATTGRGYTDDQERRYGLVKYFKEEQFDEAFSVVRNVAAGTPRETGARARERLLADKVNGTNWMVDYFERHFA